MRETGIIRRKQTWKNNDLQGLTLKRIRFSSHALQHFQCPAPSLKTLGRQARPLAFLTFVLLLTVALAPAQDSSKEKLPIIDKLTSEASHQAFSGIVQSLDEKHNILNVNSVEGGATEVFPVKKSTLVLTPGGDRLKPADLTPGTNVIVYFELHAEHRTVKRIEILHGESKKPAPRS